MKHRRLYWFDIREGKREVQITRGDGTRREYPEAKSPRLVVSWSDAEYHKGTIYKAFMPSGFLEATRWMGGCTSHEVVSQPKGIRFPPFP